MQQVDTGDAAVLRSLELYGEHVGEPTTIIYERFFARYPEAEEMFAYDRHVEERMMSSVLMMISDLADHTSTIDECLYWITDHVAWEVSRDMVFDMFEMIHDTICEGLGERWTPEMGTGWHNLLGRMKPAMAERITEIEGYSRVPDLSARV